MPESAAGRPPEGLGLRRLSHRPGEAAQQQHQETISVSPFRVLQNFELRSFDARIVLLTYLASVSWLTL